MNKILKNKKEVIFDVDSNDKKWLDIQRNDVIQVKVVSYCEIFVIIEIDGINIFDGNKLNPASGMKKRVVNEEVFYKWYTGEQLKFTQLHSDYSIANDGDPKKRGEITIYTFSYDDDEPDIIDTYYYSNKE